jgi:AcrR family transcriptional regulator
MAKMRKGRTKATKAAAASAHRRPSRATPTGSPSRKAEPRKSARARKIAPELRRQAILEAALAVFAERGFAAARLDDVAARAGVAKGTLYLYFHSKEALFEALIRDAISPLLAHVGAVAAAPDMAPIKALETFFHLFETEVLGTDRKLLLRLIISEGTRFPALAEIYYREVVTRGLRILRSLAERATKDGSFATTGPARFPQLVVAPLMVAVIWDALFAKIELLDVTGLLGAHLETLKGKGRKGSP